jgi:hypothetical protein
MFLAGLMVLPVVALMVPTASAYPNCEVGTGQWGVGVVCAGGSGPLGVCTLVLYDTANVRWAIAGYYVCL